MRPSLIYHGFLYEIVDNTLGCRAFGPWLYRTRAEVVLEKGHLVRQHDNPPSADPRSEGFQFHSKCHKEGPQCPELHPSASGSDG